MNSLEPAAASPLSSITTAEYTSSLVNSCDSSTGRPVACAIRICFYPVSPIAHQIAVPHNAQIISNARSNVPQSIEIALQLDGKVLYETCIVIGKPAKPCIIPLIVQPYTEHHVTDGSAVILAYPSHIGNTYEAVVNPGVQNQIFNNCPFIEIGKKMIYIPGRYLVPLEINLSVKPVDHIAVVNLNILRHHVVFHGGAADCL